MLKKLSALLATGICVAVAGAAWAADPVQQHNAEAMWFVNWVGLSNASLVVAAPNGKITQINAPSGTPVFKLDRAEAQDGVYHYELTAATEERQEIVNPMDNGRGAAAETSEAVPFHATGHFVVSRGAIITPEEIKEEG